MAGGAAISYKIIAASSIGANILVYKNLSGAAVIGIGGASPIPLRIALESCKGGSHGENHDQSQSDCENLLHFFKSLSIILCFASDGGFPPGEARFARPSA